MPSTPAAKTSRNSVLLQSNINNTRSDVANLIRVLLEICNRIERDLAKGGDNARAAFVARVKSLMEDVPALPNEQWVELTGKVVPKSASEKNSWVPSFTVESSTSVAEPVEPYES